MQTISTRIRIQVTETISNHNDYYITSTSKFTSDIFVLNHEVDMKFLWSIDRLVSTAYQPVQSYFKFRG